MGVLGGRLRAAQSALPGCDPRRFTHREEGGRQAGLGFNDYCRPRPSTPPFQELAGFHPAVNWRFSVKNRVKRPDMEADTKSDKNLALCAQHAYVQA